MSGADRFRVGVSAGIRSAGGELRIPGVDLSPLDDDPRIECVALPEGGELLGPDVLGDLDAVILLLERIGAQSFAGGDRLALVARFGVGYDRIDVPACTANGVALAITPDGVRRPVAVAAIAFMLALTTNLIAKDRITREGAPGWARKTDYNGLGLVGRTLGLLGVGNIGAEIFRLARPFGMRHVAHDPYADAALLTELDVEPVGIEALFETADVVMVSCPLNDETRGLVGARLIGRMKPSAYLVNTARGPIVDQAALTVALAEHRIAGAGLDVFEQEPPDADHPLLALDNVVLAPHALCFTDQCMHGNGAGDVEACLAVMNGRAPAHVVDRDVIEGGTFRAKLASYAERFG